MDEEKRPIDPTRKLLKIFGVKVTDYEEKTGAILEQLRRVRDARELVEPAAQVVELTADLNARLRELVDHVLDMQARALNGVRDALEKAQK
ncbi:MAG: hypothetical protein HY561_11820 [Gemmatimonadetes bacterium]|nr:hypothetical protein [Gemmatimonadota bacterium]